MPDQTVWAETLIASQADVGSMLRAARESLGVSLETVARDLRIRIPYLQAIEEARFAELPGPAYAVAFLRSYAAYVGFSAEDIVAAYRRHDGVEPQASALRFPVVESEKRLPRGLMVVMSVLLLAGAYVVWNVIGRQDVAPAPPVAELPSRLQPAAPAAASAPVAVPPAAEPAAGAAANPGAAKPAEPARTAIDPAPAARPAPPRPADTASAAAATPAEPRSGDAAAAPARQPPAGSASAATPPASAPPPSAAPAAQTPARGPPPTAAVPPAVAPAPQAATAPAAAPARGAAPTAAAPPAAAPAPQAATAPGATRSPAAAATPVPPPATTATPSSGPAGATPPPAAAAAPPAPAAAPPAPGPAVQPSQPRERTIKVSRPMILELRDQTGREVLATVNLRAGDTYIVPSYIAYRLLPDS